MNELNETNKTSDPVIAMLNTIKEIRSKQLEMNLEIEKIKNKQKSSDGISSDQPLSKSRSRLIMNEVIKDYAQENEINRQIVWAELFHEFYLRKNHIFPIRQAGLEFINIIEKEGLLDDLAALAVELFC